MKRCFTWLLIAVLFTSSTVGLTLDVTPKTIALGESTQLVAQAESTEDLNGFVYWVVSKESDAFSSEQLSPLLTSGYTWTPTQTDVYTVRARGERTDGGVVWSNTVQLTVQEGDVSSVPIPPPPPPPINPSGAQSLEVTITTPQDGQLFLSTQTVTLETSIRDPNSELTKFSAYLNDVFVESTITPPFTVQLPILPPGTHTVRVDVETNSQVVREAVTFTVTTPGDARNLDLPSVPASNDESCIRTCAEWSICSSNEQRRACSFPIGCPTAYTETQTCPQIITVYHGNANPDIEILPSLEFRRMSTSVFVGAINARRVDLSQMLYFPERLPTQTTLQDSDTQKEYDITYVGVANGFVKYAIQIQDDSPAVLIDTPQTQRPQPSDSEPFFTSTNILLFVIVLGFVASSGMAVILLTKKDSEKKATKTKKHVPPSAVPVLPTTIQTTTQAMHHTEDPELAKYRSYLPSLRRFARRHKDMDEQDLRRTLLLAHWPDKVIDLIVQQRKK